MSGVLIFNHIRCLSLFVQCQFTSSLSLRQQCQVTSKPNRLPVISLVLNFVVDKLFWYRPLSSVLKNDNVREISKLFYQVQPAIG